MPSLHTGLRVARIVSTLVLIISATGGIAAANVRAQEQVEPALKKANAYIEFSKSTERGVESWERYQSWVSMKNGPTGKEEYIDYGMYDVSDPATVAKDAREAMSTEPKSAALDAAMARYITAYEAIAPLFNEGAAYYDNKGYLTDNAAKGQELHKKMMPLAKAFLAERQALLAELRPFVRDVEGQELAALEADEGRKASWYIGQVMHAANRLTDVFPRIRPEPIDQEALNEQINALGPDTPGEKFDEIIRGTTTSQTIVIDVKHYSEALRKYEDAVKVFDGFSGEKPDDFDDFKPLPAKLLNAARALEGPLKKSEGRDFEGGGQMAGQLNQVYIEMINTSSPMLASQLRYLP